MPRNRAFAIVLCLLLSSGCIRTMGKAPLRLMPTESGRPSCNLDPRLPGIWKTSIFSTLGPATAVMGIHCNCSYNLRFRLFGFMFLKESGPLRVEADALVFGRVQGKDLNTYFETNFPYAFDGEFLLIEDGNPEPSRYRRIRDFKTCKQE